MWDAAIAATGQRVTSMGFWSGYWSSLKPLEVEEPIDVYVHRPLAYLLARASFHTPITPTAITLLSIAAGLGSAVALLTEFAHHLVVGGALLFLSAVFDCADGQLARMRKTSSVIGRMIDGCADLITSAAVAPATVYVLWRTFETPRWFGYTVVVLATATIVTSSFHTTMYDHYKNVFLRLTGPFHEGEDYEAARARYESTAPSARSFAMRLAYNVYFFYLKSQRDYVLKFDPYTSARLTLFPSYDPERAAVYRACAGRAMRLWRSVFGFGSMIFGLALFNAIGHAEIYLALRLVLLNAIFYGYLRPAQQRASREAFARMGVSLPDQAGGRGQVFA